MAKQFVRTPIPQFIPRYRVTLVSEGGHTVADLNHKVQQQVKQECPGVKWLANYAVRACCGSVGLVASSSDFHASPA
jgi:hypothetical protein